MARNQALDKFLKQIQRLPPKDAVMVAARAAMRVLPILAEIAPAISGLSDHHFGKTAGEFSRETSTHLIFSVFRACQCAAVAVNTYAEAAATTAYAAHAWASFRDYPYTIVGACTYAYAIAAARYAAHSAIDAVTDAASEEAARAYAYAAVAAKSAAVDKAAREAKTDKIDPFLSFLSADLNVLSNQAELSSLPLWLPAEAMPDLFKSCWDILQSLMISLDPGFEYWIDWYEARLHGEPLIWEEIRDQILLTEEQLKQEPEAINAYLLKLAKRPRVVSYASCSAFGASDSAHGSAVFMMARPLNRVRAILIGPGFAGKTSLLRALHGEPIVEGKEDMTVGIEISESSFDSQTNRYQKGQEDPNEPIVHFWDFGGQVMYHATHQFFLRSNCVYVLVLDGRRGSSETDYWLEHVRAFAPSAPVLIVGNKADLGPMDWDQNRLRKKYPNIRPHGFYQLACTQLAEPDNDYREEFAKFKRHLRKALDEVGMVQQKFTPQEFAVLDELRRRSPLETFLPKESYEKLCMEQGLRPTESLDPAAVLLDMLDKLGVVIHFPNLPRLDEFLLNPRWLTYGVYQIIDRKQPRVSEAEAFDCLSRAEVADNLGNRLAYPRNRCGFILDAMEQFKVAYRLTPAQGGQRFEIPSLLPTDEPADLDFPESAARAFRFRFEGLLPPQLLPQLIVARHADIDQGKVWRHGAVLRTRHNGGAWALLRGDAYDRILTLWVTGPGLDRYFAVLYQNVKDILVTMPELPYEELIRLPVAARLDGESGLFDADEPWGRWVNVLHAALDGETYYREEGVKYDLKKVLGIMAEADRRNLVAELERESRAFHLHHHYSEHTKMGDTIHISGGQQGAVGSHAQAKGNVFVQNPALEDLSSLLAQLLADLRNAEHMDANQREDAIYEVETACEALQDLQAEDPARKAKAEGRLKRILGGIKGNVGPVADGIAVLKDIQSAGMAYGPALVAAVDAVWHLIH